ncbi:MAG: hypothetical protein RIE52_11840 [Balneola sp.]
MKYLLLLSVIFLNCSILGEDADVITVESKIGHTIQFGETDSGLMYNLTLIEGDLDKTDVKWVVIKGNLQEYESSKGQTRLSKLEVSGSDVYWMGFINSSD